MRKTFILVSFLVGCIQLTFAQLNNEEVAKIDELFTTWQQPNHPGGSIGIMKNGRVVYSKAYGLASLEYQIPNETNTLYNAASVSKQFTALGIVLLHLKGKIDIDADINTYLPTMPKFQYPIATRQMLHHTSGMRSLHALLGLAGWRHDDSRTNEDLYRFMEKQVDLNFKPNDEYLYCNTGYMLMAKIIENVTGEDFVSWMKKEVFDPLEMTATYVEKQYNRVVPNNATSYDANNGTYDRSTEFWGYVGSGNMHTTTADLLTYLHNYSKPKTGWEEVFEMMQTLDSFNDGSHNKYAFGVNVDEYRGNKRIQHGGSIGGYRANSVAFPDNDLQIAILANFSSSNVGKVANEIADILLSTNEMVFSNREKPSKRIKTHKLKVDDLFVFEGDYWSSKAHSGVKLKVKNDTLRLFDGTEKDKSLIPINAKIFKNPNQLNLHYGFKEGELQITNSENDTIRFQKYIKTTPTIADLMVYEGRYYSDELETFYDIYLKSGNLYSHHPRHGDFKIEWVKEDVLKGAYPFSFVIIERNEQRRVIGLKVTNGRLKNAWFKKVKL